MTSQNNNQPDHKPDETLLLAYVENRLTDDERRTVERELANHPKLITALSAMSEDRQVMRDAADEDQAPDGLVETVLMQIERTMLLDAAPDAPLVELPRRRHGLFKKLAAAAAFLLLLSGVSIIVFQSLSSSNKENKTLEELLAEATVTDEQPGDPGPVETIVPPDEDQPVEIVETNPSDEVVVEPTDELPTVQPSDDHRLAAAPNDEDVEQPIVSPIPHPKSLTTDLGYAALIEGADRDEILSSLVNGLQPSGGVLSNVPITTEPTDESEPDHRMANGTNWSGAQVPLRYIQPIRPIPLQGHPSYGRLSNGDPIFASVEIIPLDDQLRYYDEGYEFTLIGTPTDLRRLLRSLIGSDETRFKWSKKPVNGESSLDDLANPPQPIGPQWINATLWWLDPINNLPKAQAAAMSSQPEPLIRIPIRIQESNR